MTKRAFNPTDGPVVINDDGLVLGGGDWADVDPTNEVVEAAVQQGRLLYPEDERVSEPPASPSPPDVPAPAADDSPEE